MIAKCEICQKEYYIRPSHYRRVKRHFCSVKCRGLSQRIIKKSYCLECGRVFYKNKPSRKNKFCSKKCFIKSRTGQKSPRYNRVIKRCPICKKEIKVIYCLRDKNIFCSRECADKRHSVKMKKDGNPNWRGGIGKLPWGFEFTKELKRKIKKRDKYVCRVCGTKGVCIHHIDYDKHNNNPNNLILLCSQCHGKTGHNRKQWKKKLSEMLKK